MDSQTVSFSICIPNFNYARYIGATIQSVLDQTYPHYEIIVVDNASTDDSMAVVTGIKSDRIRLFRNSYNVGFAPNLDRAAAQARNPFIVMLSSDDLMKPTALEEYARVIQTLGDDALHALVTSGIDYIDQDGHVLPVPRAQKPPVDPNAPLTARIAESGVFVLDGLDVFKYVFPRNMTPGPFCATAYSRILYDRVGGYSSVHPLGPDADFAYKALLLGAKVVVFEKELFQYRVHNTNNANQDRRQRSMKTQIDRYLFTVQFSDAELKRADVKREDAAASLVDQACLKTGLAEMKDGERSFAFRLLAFAFATYPGPTLRNPKCYLLILLLLSGPLGTLVARGLWRFRLMWTSEPSRAS